MVIKEEKLEKEVLEFLLRQRSKYFKGIPDKPGIAGNIFALLSSANINDMIVQNITDDGKFASLILLYQ